MITLMFVNFRDPRSCRGLNNKTIKYVVFLYRILNKFLQVTLYQSSKRFHTQVLLSVPYNILYLNQGV